MSKKVQDLLRSFDGKPCPYCHEKMDIRGLRRPTRDHIRPRRAGGTLEDWNRVVVCDPCNNNKGRLMLEQWARRLTDARDPRAAIVWALVEAGLDPFGKRVSEQNVEETKT